MEQCGRVQDGVTPHQPHSQTGLHSRVKGTQTGPFVFGTMSGTERLPPNDLKNQDWIDKWNLHEIAFHKDCIHPGLEKYIDLLVNGRSNLRIFVPLCGKSWDMKWLADHGHTAIGVEVVQRAVEEFFEEQSIPFTCQPAPQLDGTLYQSEDKKILIYCCDFFNISPEIVGKMDAVWDRASMVAINVCDRSRYAAVMQSLMNPQFTYLLSALQYDDSNHPGPPHSLLDDAIQEAFEPFATVKEIDCVSALEDNHRERWKIDWLNEKTFLITPKS